MQAQPRLGGWEGLDGSLLGGGEGSLATLSIRYRAEFFMASPVSEAD